MSVEISTVKQLFDIVESDLKNNTHTDIKFSDDCEGIETISEGAGMGLFTKISSRGSR